jgi:putative ABC transport system ATP-binding protein
MIRVENLVKMYENGVAVRALDGVTAEIDSGEFLALIGPSGSGKTTLLNLIGALDVPTSGRVVIDGQDISALRGNALADFHRKKIGFVFQAFHLVPSLTALENVMLPLLPYQKQCAFDLEKRALELLERMELIARRNHFPSQLSGGEQQRVAIARALVNTPTYVLADEPTGNLDSQSGKEIIALLENLNNESGTTVIVATHDLSIQEKVNRIIRLQDGCLL